MPPSRSAQDPSLSATCPSPKSTGSESISRINRVRQRRILVHQRRIRVYRRRIRVYRRRIIRIYRHPLPPLGLARSGPDENRHNTSTLPCSPPPGIASLHHLSPHGLPSESISAGSEPISDGILVHQRRIRVYRRRIRVYRRRIIQVYWRGRPHAAPDSHGRDRQWGAAAGPRRPEAAASTIVDGTGGGQLLPAVATLDTESTGVIGTAAAGPRCPRRAWAGSALASGCCCPRWPRRAWGAGCCCRPTLNYASSRPGDAGPAQGVRSCRKAPGRGRVAHVRRVQGAEAGINGAAGKARPL